MVIIVFETDNGPYGFNAAELVITALEGLPRTKGSRRDRTIIHHHAVDNPEPRQVVVWGTVEQVAQELTGDGVEPEARRRPMGFEISSNEGIDLGPVPDEDDDTDEQDRRAVVRRVGSTTRRKR